MRYFHVRIVQHRIHKRNDFKPVDFYLFDNGDKRKSSTFDVHN